MGSYYGTCGVTNLPIKENDEVVLFVLENAFKENIVDSIGMRHADALFYPVSPPIRAICDYWGNSFEPVKDGKEAAKTFVSWIKRIAPNYSDVRNWDEFDARRRDNATVPGYENTGQVTKSNKQLYIFPIHAVVYEKMIANIFGDKNENFLTGCLFKEAKRQAAFTRDSLRRILKEGFKPDMDNFSKEAAEKFLRSEVPHITNFPLHEMAEPGFKLKDEETTLEDIPKAALELIAFRRSMNNMRKTFMPLNGAGSQTLANDLHKDISDFVSSHVNSPKPRRSP